MPKLLPRHYSTDTVQQLIQSGLSPLLARIYAARGITDTAQLDTSLARLLPFTQLKNATQMAVYLADAIAAQKKLLIVADYDCDGATACAVAMRGLASMGARVEFIVPNRFEYGYGLTPEIVRLAAQSTPDLLITVDNGISSVEGVAEANRLGMQVLVTDHHLPGDALPDALCIVNPNQPGCGFPSKHLAGVGVMFYVLLALRAELRARGGFTASPLPPARGKVAPARSTPWLQGAKAPATHAGMGVETSNHTTTSHTSVFTPTLAHPLKGGGDIVEPNLGNLLDLVALGTVADVVVLDDNNRILVQQGLQRIRTGRGCAGISALLQLAKKPAAQAQAYEMGFIVGPRLNAAGRLEDMSLGIQCLLTHDANEAADIAAKLDALNQERRGIEADMQQAALAALEHIDPTEGYSLALFDASWHQGVIGILASRLKDKFHRPTLAFARASEGELKGSGRSIPGLHLRDALDLVAKRHPHLLHKFGGHAMAAGLSLHEADFEEFKQAFESVAQSLLSTENLTKTLATDGTLDAADFSLHTAQQLDQQVWGQGFAAPIFEGEFEVIQQRIVGEKHLKLKLAQAGKTLDAMHFFCIDDLPPRIHAAYKLSVNEYNGKVTVQLILECYSEVKEKYKSA